MFLPPEHRHPGPPPSEPPTPRRELSKREEAVLSGVVCFVVLTIFVAPIGGSTILEALRYLISR